MYRCMLYLGITNKKTLELYNYIFNVKYIDLNLLFFLINWL